jgi:hypothetical protein
MGQGVQGEQATPNANPHLLSLTIVCIPSFPFHSIPLTVDWLLLFAGAVVVRLFHKCYCLHTAIHIVTTAVVITTEKTTQSHAAASSAAVTHSRPPCLTHRCRGPNAEPRCRPRCQTPPPDPAARPPCQTHSPVTPCPECYQTRDPPVLLDLMMLDSDIRHSMLGLLSAIQPVLSDPTVCFLRSHPCITYCTDTGMSTCHIVQIQE